MKVLKILVACEESQRVCQAFRDLGHEAYSCDVIPPSGGHPEWHILGDAVPVLRGGYQYCMNGDEHYIEKWDLIVAHPPCTYISNAGACRLYPRKGELNQERYQKGLEAKDFFMTFYNADCEHICIENPIPSKVFNLPPYSQTIQPYEYGEPFSKKTCLWLKGLPKLQPTKIVEPIGSWVCGNSNQWKREFSEKGYVVGHEKSPKHRSKTFKGIAEAIAKQFSEYILKGVNLSENS